MGVGRGLEEKDRGEGLGEDDRYCAVYLIELFIYIYGSEAITFPVRSTAFQKKKICGENGCPHRGMNRHSNLPPWSSRQVK